MTIMEESQTISQLLLLRLNLITKTAKTFDFNTLTEFGVILNYGGFGVLGFWGFGIWITSVLN